MPIRRSTISRRTRKRRRDKLLYLIIYRRCPCQLISTRNVVKMEMMWWERDGIGLYPTRMAIRSFTRNFLYGYFFRISEGLGKQGALRGQGGTPCLMFVVLLVSVAGSGYWQGPWWICRLEEGSSIGPCHDGVQVRGRRWEG